MKKKKTKYFEIRPLDLSPVFVMKDHRVLYRAVSWSDNQRRAKGCEAVPVVIVSRETQEAK